MTNREVMQQALEALETLQGGCTDSDDGTVDALTVWCPEVITALREALEQPEQEPSAWRDMMVVSLVREGVNKHRARELADHFAAQPESCQTCVEIHLLLDADESMIIRNARDGYPEGRPPRELTLLERVKALCTYAADWKRWCIEAQTPPAAQWDKPSASFDEWWDSDVMPSANPFTEGSAAFWAWAGWRAAQRPWVGLEAEDLAQIESDEFWQVGNHMAIAMAVEDKLKERNND